MNASTVRKCRTCLRSSAKTVPLTRNASGCNPERTYGALLQEYANIECIANYECFMPQYLCLQCSRELKNTYAFVRQAQYCHNKLINVICKQMDCLLERTIDLPASAKDLEKNLEIKVEISTDDCPNSGRDELSLQSLNEESPTDNRTTESNNDVENKETSDNKQNDSNDDLPLKSSETTDNNKITTDLKINTNKTEIKSVCPICKKDFSSLDNLIKHVRIQHDIENPRKLFLKSKHEDKTDFSCKLCPVTYSNKYTYLYHLKNKHHITSEKKGKQKQKSKIIKCRSCNYIAKTYASLSYHKRSKHGTDKDKFKCNFCSNMYLRKFLLLKHIKSAHKEQIKSLKAEAEIKGGTQSGATTDDIVLIQQMNISLLTASANSGIEQEETEEFSDEEFIRNILNIKKRKTKLTANSLARRCNECGNIYKDYRALSIHKKQVHISEDKYSLCPHCGKKYKRKIDLKIHIEKAHIEKTKISKSSNEIARQPPKAREKRFMCAECSYVCSTITILNIHVNRHHTGEKPYKCDICLKSFIVPYDLKIHRYLHTGERPYKCPICSKGFRDNSHLVKHKRIHSSERPYKCTECNKSFGVPYNLSVHRRRHLKEKKLYCVVCSKVFENRSLLNLHRINENHHDEDA